MASTGNVPKTRGEDKQKFQLFCSVFISFGRERLIKSSLFFCLLFFLFSPQFFCLFSRAYISGGRHFSANFRAHRRMKTIHAQLNYYSDVNGLDLDQCRWTCKSSLDYFYFSSTCWCGLHSIVFFFLFSTYSIFGKGETKQNKKYIFQRGVFLSCGKEKKKKHDNMQPFVFRYLLLLFSILRAGRHLLNVHVGLICITNGARHDPTNLFYCSFNIILST